ncbi:MAG: matrixin family metalloprotease [Ornithinibacter sp.]
MTSIDPSTIPDGTVVKGADQCGRRVVSVTADSGANPEHDLPDAPGLERWGLTTCNSLSGSTCEQHTVRFDVSYFNAASQSNERGLACHEFGHSLGLTHRDTESGCMKMYGAHPTYLTVHDESHLNDDY